AGAAVASRGCPRPGYVVIAVVAELASLACYAALVGLLLRLGVVSVPFRALLSLTVVGIAMLNSLPGGWRSAAAGWPPARELPWSLPLSSFSWSQSSPAGGSSPPRLDWSGG